MPCFTMTKITLSRPDFSMSFHQRKNVFHHNNDTNTIKFPVFDDGTLETALYWHKRFNELVQPKNLMLKPSSPTLFVSSQDQTKDNSVNSIALFLISINCFISLCGATSNTAEYLREFLTKAKKPAKMKLQDFKCHLFELDHYLPYFPGPLNVPWRCRNFSTLKKCVPNITNSNTCANVSNFKALM